MKFLKAKLDKEQPFSSALVERQNIKDYIIFGNFSKHADSKQFLYPGNHYK
jgi:hypothetical protein